MITIPMNVAQRLAVATDLSGDPVQTLAKFTEKYNESFKYEFVEDPELTEAERYTWESRHQILALAGGLPSAVRTIRLSRTIQPSLYGDSAGGCWDPAEQMIVIRVDQLNSRPSFAGTLLHELAHVRSGAPDVSRAFESELTGLLGAVAVAQLDASA